MANVLSVGISEWALNCKLQLKGPYNLIYRSLSRGVSVPFVDICQNITFANFLCGRLINKSICSQFYKMAPETKKIFTHVYRINDLRH